MPPKGSRTKRARSEEDDDEESISVRPKRGLSAGQVGRQKDPIKDAKKNAGESTPSGEKQGDEECSSPRPSAPLRVALYPCSRLLQTLNERRSRSGADSDGPQTQVHGVEYFVSWVGFSAEHNEWIPAVNVESAPELLQKYWDTRPPMEQCERYKPNSKLWRQAKADATAAAMKEKREKAIRNGVSEAEVVEEVMEDEEWREERAENAGAHLQTFNESLVNLFDALRSYNVEATSTAPSTSRSTSTALSNAAAALSTQRDAAGLALLHLLHAMSSSSFGRTIPPLPASHSTLIKREISPPPQAPLALQSSVDARFEAMERRQEEAERRHSEEVAALRQEVTTREEEMNTRMIEESKRTMEQVEQQIASAISAIPNPEAVLEPGEFKENIFGAERRPSFPDPRLSFSPDAHHHEELAPSLSASTSAQPLAGVLTKEDFHGWKTRLWEKDIPQMEDRCRNRIGRRAAEVESKLAETTRRVAEVESGLVKSASAVAKDMGERKLETEETMKLITHLQVRLKFFENRQIAFESQTNKSFNEQSKRISDYPTPAKIAMQIQQAIANAQIALKPVPLPTTAPPPAPPMYKPFPDSRFQDFDKRLLFLEKANSTSSAWRQDFQEKMEDQIKRVPNLVDEGLRQVGGMVDETVEMMDLRAKILPVVREEIERVAKEAKTIRDAKRKGG
ncbi:hypothetical protein P7C70_g4642, partial [Phenoliferia sp. Uapishka_3]